MQPHPFDIVAIGASAGGVEALFKLLHALPADLLFSSLARNAGKRAIASSCPA